MNFFDSLIEILTAIGTYFVNLVKNVLVAMETLAVVPSVAVYLQGFLPTILSTSMLIVLAIGVIKLILGWGNV